MRHLKTFELQSSTLRSAGAKFRMIGRETKSNKLLKWINARNFNDVGNLKLIMLNDNSKYENSVESIDKIEAFDWELYTGRTNGIEISFKTGNSKLTLKCPIVDGGKLLDNYKWEISQPKELKKGLLMGSRESAIKFKKMVLSNVSKIIIENEGGDEYFNETLLRSINKDYPKSDCGPDDVKEILESLNKLSINSLWIERWNKFEFSMSELYKSLNDLNK